MGIQFFASFNEIHIFGSGGPGGFQTRNGRRFDINVAAAEFIDWLISGASGGESFPYRSVFSRVNFTVTGKCWYLFKRTPNDYTGDQFLLCARESAMTSPLS